MQLVSVDIGGTHARFAIAEVENGRVVSLGEPVTLKTAEHASLQTAWQHFGSIHGTPCPGGGAVGRLADHRRHHPPDHTIPG